jgi:hypothetical protein
MLTAIAPDGFGGRRIFQIAGQGIELRFPELAVVLDPRGRIFHRLRAQAATMHPAIFLALDQTGALQHPQMLRHCWERHLVGRGEVAHRRFTLLCETSQNSAARRIRKRGKRRIERDA